MAAVKKPFFRTLSLAVHRLLRSKTARLAGICLNTSDAAIPRTIQTAVFKGIYELPEQLLVQAAVTRGDRVIEIGAGIGFISLLCASRAGAENVLSFEENPAMEGIIRGNYALNGIAPKLVMKAVTVSGEPIEFFQSDNIISSSLLNRDNEARKIRVDAEAINDVIAAHRPNIIVMDVEGAEIALLPAADLDGIKSIVVELHPHIVGQAKIDEMIELLCQRGFYVAQRIEKNVLLNRGSGAA